MKYTFSMLIILLAAALLFISCDSTPNESNGVKPEMNFSAENAIKYTIIRSDTAESYETQTAIKLREALVRLTGEEIIITTDWDGDADHTKRLEILIGDTNREQSAAAFNALAGDDFIVRQIGEKLVIAAGSEDVLNAAADYFLKSYFGYSTTAVSPKQAGYHTIKSYGAVGDGITNDTEAFKTAVAAAETDGLPVYVPYGTYLVTDTITLNSVTLYGYQTAAWTADNCDMPVIYHKNMEKPLFDVRSGSLSGVKIMASYDATIKCAATVMITGTGGRVSDMTIHNPAIAILCDDASNPGRCFLQNIFIVQANEMGVYVAGTYDVPTLSNIEVWNNGATCPVAFRFAHNDDLRAVNLFAFNANIGFLIDTSETGTFWGSLSNCSVDFTSIGIKITGGSAKKGTHHITITGGAYWTHHMCLQVEANTSAWVTASGCEFKSNGERTVNIQGGNMITVTGCNINRTFDSGGDIPAVSISGGDMVNISCNTIDSRSDGIEITSKNNTAAITGNVIRCGGKAVSDMSENSVVKNESNAVSEGYKYE
ncbi:MAG: right-handed parallel beta-helix repeat-containing protein [Eubacteriales bacterium]